MYVFAAFLVYSYAVVILVCAVMYRYVIWFTSYVVMSCHVCVCMRTMNEERDSVASANGSSYKMSDSQCRAQMQCEVIQKRDQAFHSHHPKRFNTV